MKLVIGADHRGFLLKKDLQVAIGEILWVDVGSFDSNPVDYPLIAHQATNLVSKGIAAGGVLLCGSGVGMTIVANRYQGIRAALVWSAAVAKQSKEHDDSNMIIFPADYISTEQAIEAFRAWHGATFLGGKYERRVKEIDQLLNGQTAR